MGVIEFILFVLYFFGVIGLILFLSKYAFPFTRRKKVNYSHILSQKPEHKQAPKTYTCPCCGYITLSESPGNYDICKICYWEDDPKQRSDPGLKSGANIHSLKEAQQNYIKYGYCEERIKKHVKKPTPSDKKDLTWQPFL